MTLVAIDLDELKDQLNTEVLNDPARAITIGQIRHVIDKCEKIELCHIDDGVASAVWVNESRLGMAVCSNCEECFETGEDDGGYERSAEECYEDFVKEYRFCPCCGRKMKKQEAP